MSPGTLRILISLLAGNLLFLPACSTPSGGTGSEPTVAVVGDQPPDGQPEQLELVSEIGREVIVDLPANGGTGYTWSMTAHSEGIELTKPPTTEPVRSNLPGGPTLTSFTLKMTGTGRQTARLELARTWEAETPAARIVNVVINVDEAR
jgi:predicted secreted protein